MQPILKLDHILHRIGLVISGIMVVVMAALVFVDVICRYFLNSPIIWVMDVTRFMLCYIVFLGLAPALRDGSHVSVDLFLEWFGPKARFWLQLIAKLLLVAFSAYFLWILGTTTYQAFLDNRLSPTSFPFPLKWVYIVGPIGMFIFLFASIVHLIEYLYSRGKAQGT